MREALGGGASPELAGPELAREVQRGVRPRVGIRFEAGRLVVKCADRASEMDQVLRLRHDVFYEELAGRRLSSGIDTDAFDESSDHLIIMDKATDTVVGTYRIRCSAFTDRFYTATEFDLSGFLRDFDGVKMEIGRACVSPAYRKGTVNQLLWRGLMEYAIGTGSRYLFGCSSLPFTCPDKVAAVSEHLKAAGHLITPSEVARPLRASDAPDGGSTAPGPGAEELVPPLLRFYLNAGARLYGDPAWDHELRCVDFFTVLDLTQVTARYQRKYGSCSM